MNAPVQHPPSSTDPDPITNPEPITTPGGRVVAPGGWRRAITGVAVGMAAGVLHRLARQWDEAAAGSRPASMAGADGRGSGPSRRLVTGGRR